MFVESQQQVRCPTKGHFHVLRQSTSSKISLSLDIQDLKDLSSLSVAPSHSWTHL